MKQEKIPLTEKYRPQAFQDLVLPSPHGLGAAVRFIDNPTRSRWMLAGKSGLGKTSLAEIMARACAEPMCTEHFVGPDLDSTQVAKIVSATRTSPLFGRFYCYVCHEADAIPPGGQVRLLSALEDTAPAIWIFTSNEEAENWEPRFLSRFTVLQFSNQGLADPATRWLCRISMLEGMELSYAEGEKIVRAAKNNLRAALQRLEVILGDYQDSGRITPLAIGTLIPVNLPLPSTTSTSAC